jgi:hypothetical protein
MRHAGGVTTVAFREDEKQHMVPKNKSIELRSLVIEVDAGPLLGHAADAAQDNTGSASASHHSWHASGSPGGLHLESHSRMKGI